MDKECEISGVLRENVPAVWPHVAPLIERALLYADGLFSLDDVLEAIMLTKMQLWIIVNADGEVQGCTTTEFVHYPNDIVCRLPFTAGNDVESWEHLLDDIEVWAAEQGATKMQAFARFGWKRFARKHGYTTELCIYTKPLQIDKSQLQ